MPLSGRKTVRYRVWNSKTRQKSAWHNTVADAVKDHERIGGVIQRVEMGCPVRITTVQPDP